MFPVIDAGYWSIVVQIGALAFLLGILISRFTDATRQQSNLVDRTLLALITTLRTVVLITLTFGFDRRASDAVPLSLAAAAIAAGLLLLRRNPRRSEDDDETTVTEDEARLAARLGETEGLYRALAEAASDAIVISQDLRIVFANPAAARLAGLASVNDLLGRPVMDFIAPEARELARQRQQELAAGRPAPMVETRYLRADGTEFDVEVSSAPFVLNGRPAIVAIVRDISERKQMAQALARSEARFRGMTELSSDWYWEQDTEYRVTFMSERYSAANGLKMKPTLGQTRFETDNIWESEDQKRRHLEDLDARRPFRDLRLSRRDEDGKLRYFSISGRPVFDDKGEFTGYYGTGRDITRQEVVERALRENEARFRSLSELSSDWFWEQDAQLRFTDRVSEGVERMGLRREKLIGQRYQEIAYYEPTTADEWLPIEQAIDEREPFRDVVIRMRNEAGEIRYVSVSGAPFFENGRFAGYRGAAKDITERERQREDLQLFRLAMETTPDAIFITDMRELRHLDVNATACRMLGYERDELLALHPWDLTPSLTPDDFAARYEEARRIGPDRFATELKDRIMLRKDGGELPVEVYRRHLKTRDREIVVSVVRDISARLAVDQALRLRDRALESSVNAIVITRADGDHEVEYVNPAFERLTGYSADETRGRNLRFLQREDRDQPDLAKLRDAISRGEDAVALLRNYTRDGMPFWNEMRIAPVQDGERVQYYVGVLHDVTAAKRYQDELAHQATHDLLTGVANRTLLEDRIEQAIASARRHQRLFAVVFVDLDHFKRINDEFGHTAGDAVLCEVALRIKSSIRGDDTLARYAGDEFVVILSELDNEEAIGTALMRLRGAVSRPIELDGRAAAVTCSMGACVYPRDGASAEELLRHADAAMYQAKESGRDAYRFFTHGLNERSQSRVEIEGRLRGAIEAGELFLEYHPSIALGDGSVTGLEALIRWRHPELGVVPPAQFIPLAEETGLIVPIGDWVLAEVCAQLARWRTEHRLALPVSINLSARQFRRKDLTSAIAALLREHDLPPSLLGCEVTEASILHDVDAATLVLNALRELGVTVALDDFGTGYSSLAYLRRLPIDALKIDHTFVRDLTTDPDDSQIVQAIIGLAETLGLTAIAEGVEAHEQVDYLRQHGCHAAQGFLYTVPLPAADIPAWLQAHARTLVEKPARRRP